MRRLQANGPEVSLDASVEQLMNPPTTPLSEQDSLTFSVSFTP
jgi:hypothetical protein